MPVIVWMMQHSVAVVTAVFVLMAVHTYWPTRREAVERNGLIPFDDDR